MTPRESAELEALNAAVADAPDDPEPLEARARYQFHVPWDICNTLGDWRAALRLRTEKGEMNEGELAALGRALVTGSLRVAGAKNWKLMQAVAHFSLALERAPDAAALWMDRGEAWAHLYRWAQARADFERARELGEAVEVWKRQAQVFAKTGHLAEAGEFYARALALEGGAVSVEFGLEQAEEIEARVERYRALGWLNLALQGAPDNVEALLARARMFGRMGVKAEALEDYDRALELAPGNPNLWEERALRDLRQEWDEATNTLRFPDLERAFRLRHCGGAWRSERERACDFKERGDKAKERYHRDLDWARAHVFYTLALGIEPDNPNNPRLYVARARVLEMPFYDAGGEKGRARERAQSSFFDHLRALKLEPGYRNSRAAVAQTLAREARPESAHEQIEALFEARQKLVDFGLASELVSGVMREVERVLAG